MARYGIGVGAAALCSTMAIGGAAQALTLEEIVPFNPGTTILASDENRELLIKGEGNNQQDTIEVGDSIYGIFTIPQFYVTPPGQRPREYRLEHQAGNSELSGDFQIQVVGKESIGFENGVERFRFTFGVDTDWAQANAGDTSTMFRMFQDTGDTTWFDSLDDSISESVSVTTDGQAYIFAGIVSESNYFVGEGFEDVTLTGPSAFRIGESVFALDRTGGNFDLPLAVLAQGNGAGEIVGTSNIGPGLQGSAWPLSSVTHFNYQIIPTPAAVGPGLALLGFALVRRRQKQD